MQDDDMKFTNYDFQVEFDAKLPDINPPLKGNTPPIRVGKPCDLCVKLKILCTHITDKDEHKSSFASKNHDKKQLNKKLSKKSTISTLTSFESKTTNDCTKTPSGKQIHNNHMNQNSKCCEHDVCNFFSEQWFTGKYGTIHTKNGVILPETVDDLTTGVYLHTFSLKIKKK